MSHLSPTALAFIPLADLLTQLQNLINQIKFRLLSSDMISSSDQTTSTPKSFPSNFSFVQSGLCCQFGNMVYIYYELWYLFCRQVFDFCTVRLFGSLYFEYVRTHVFFSRMSSLLYLDFTL